MSKGTLAGIRYVVVVFIALSSLNTYMYQSLGSNHDVWVSKSEAFNGFPTVAETEQTKGHLCHCSGVLDTGEVCTEGLLVKHKRRDVIDNELAIIREAIEDHNAQWIAGYTPLLYIEYPDGYGWPGCIRGDEDDIVDVKRYAMMRELIKNRKSN